MILNLINIKDLESYIQKKYKTRMSPFIEVKLNKSDDQTNIDKYRVTGPIIFRAPPPDLLRCELGPDL